MQYVRHITDISLGFFAIENEPKPPGWYSSETDNLHVHVFFAQPDEPPPVPSSNPLRWGSALGEGRQP